MDENTPEAQNAAESSGSANDVQEHKIHAILAYFGLLVLVPILAAKESPFAQFHANQGLVLFIAGIIVNSVGSFIPLIGWFLVLPIGNIAILVLAIMGIINAAQGETKELPLIGQFKILK